MRDQETERERGERELWKCWIELSVRYLIHPIPNGR